MYKKYCLILLLVFSMLLVPSGTVQAAPNVVLNGTHLIFDTPPVIDNGRVLIPLRAIFEPLGAAVNWDSTSQTVTAVKGYQTIQLKIGARTASNNGKSIDLDVSAKIVNGRTLVPVRFVSEALGCNVEWAAETQTVIITDRDITVYSDPQKRFKIFYPRNWLTHEQIEMDIYEDLLLFSDPDENISSDYPGNITVAVYDRYGDTMDTIKEDSLEDYSFGTANLNVISEKDVIIAGKPGFERKLTFTLDEISLQATDIYIYNDDYIFEITVVAHADEKQGLLNKLNAAAYSIQIFDADNLDII